MPHRSGIHNPGRAQINLIVAARFPTLVRRAAKEGGFASSQAYMRHILVEALHKDLGLDREHLMDGMPPNRDQAPRFGGFYGENTKRKPKVTQ